MRLIDGMHNLTKPKRLASAHPLFMIKWRSIGCRFRFRVGLSWNLKTIPPDLWLEKERGQFRAGQWQWGVAIESSLAISVLLYATWQFFDAHRERPSHKVMVACCLLLTFHSTLSPNRANCRSILTHSSLVSLIHWKLLRLSLVTPSRFTCDYK